MLFKTFGIALKKKYFDTHKTRATLIFRDYQLIYSITSSGYCKKKKKLTVQK